MTVRHSTRLRGALAALVLLGAIAGLPLALAATVGNPIQGWPAIHTGRLSDDEVLAVLATVFWLAWLSLVIPAVLEIALAVLARATRRPPRRLRLPGLGAQQDLVRNLLGAVLLLLPAATSALPASAAPAAQRSGDRTVVTAERGGRVTDASAAHKAHQDAAPRRYVIPALGGMRSYWALAQHYLGDGARWREIWQLNEGRVHADGTVMDRPRQLRAGWTVLIPATTEDADAGPARHEVTVRPGDTLSAIAESDGIGRWARVWQLNAGRREPDGVRFADPNLILPGWRITLPGRSARQGDGEVAHPPHHGSARPTDARGLYQRAVRGRTRRSSPPAGSPGGSAARAPAGAGAEPTSLPPPPTAAPTSASRAPNPTHFSGRAEDRVPIVPLEIGLAAAAAVVALDRARRIAQRRRRIGYRALPAPAAFRDVEARVRRDARRAHPTIAAIALATALTGAAPVRVRVVLARADGAVDLRLLDPPPPPPPFIAVTGGWRLPADAASFGFALDDPATLDDPTPVLVPVGSTVDGQVLVDLATTGPVGVAGDSDAVEAFLCGVLTALHAAPWAQRVQLHVPPRLAERVGALERLTVADSLSPRPPATAPHDAADTAALEEPGWRTAPVHLFCGWPPEADLGPVLAAAAEPASRVHLVLNGAHPEAVTWTLDGDQLVCPDLDEPVTVAAVEHDRDATALVRYTATAPEVPADDPRLPDLQPAPPSEPAVPDDAAGAPEHAERPKRLLLLGPVELAGAGDLRRGQVLNLLTFLALHPRGVDRHQLLAALWPDQVISLQTMRNRIRESRRLVDGAITDGPIWRLTPAVTTDWAEFASLATGGVEDKRRALALVRGRPFAGLDDADWLDLGAFRSEVEAAVVDAALAVAEADLDSGNHPGALAAARAGLLASRYEERLHRAAIRAALAQDLHGLARTLEREMRVALELDVEPEDQMQPETLALLHELHDRRSSRSSVSTR